MSKITFHLNTYPEDTRPVWLSGSFNNWQAPQDEYRMRSLGKGRYEFDLTGEIKFPLEYKYTRGDWNQVETDEYGNVTPNHILYDSVEAVFDHVHFWQQNEDIVIPDFLPKIEVISEYFEIPQLIKTRRIAALLPYNYYETDERYPVLYLQDGQNLFDNYAPFGSWEVDKKLSLMQRRGTGNVIIVSIDHAKEDRIKEYNPVEHPSIGKGDGRKYVRFLAETLKPFIDKKFRTKPDRENTGIGGSSMGGLISIWAGFMYPEMYSKLMIFSPALWVSPNIHFHAIRFTQTDNSRVYIYAGGAESANMLNNVQRFKNELLNQELFDSDLDIKVSIDPTGKHTERKWGQEFPKAVKWLYFNEM